MKYTVIGDADNTHQSQTPINTWQLQKIGKKKEVYPEEVFIKCVQNNCYELGTWVTGDCTKDQIDHSEMHISPSSQQGRTVKTGRWPQLVVVCHPLPHHELQTCHAGTKVVAYGRVLKTLIDLTEQEDPQKVVCKLQSIDTPSMWALLKIGYV